MNIAPISYNNVNHNNNNNNIRKANQNVSFSSGKSTFAEKASTSAGCAGLVLLGLLLMPLALIGSLFTGSKKDSVESIVQRMQGEYENHIGCFSDFAEDIQEMNELLDKNTKNDKYAQFVKDAMEFLRTNFERHQGACEEYDRLEPFYNEENDDYLVAWHGFLRTIKYSAIAAISKNDKNINKELLDANIKAARELMHKTANK